MSKQYGVTCDKCKKKIVGPSDHYSITSHYLLSRAYDITRFDLCESCYVEIEHLIGKERIISNDSNS